MLEQPRWSVWSLPTLFAGALWVAQAGMLGGLAALPLWIVGALLLSSGVSQLLWPGDEHITQIGAFAGLLGGVLALPYLFVAGLIPGLLLFAAAIGGAWGAGRMAIQLEPQTEGVPAPRPSAALAAKVAADEVILGWEHWHTAGFALDGTIERVIGELDRCQRLFEREGYLEKPLAYHRTPPELVDPEIRRGRAAGLDIELLRFESGYAPAEGEPGRERWLGYDGCRDGWAYVLRHDGPPRPWLIATNGYRMGFASIDIGIFKRFHEEEGGLGLNVLVPVLPLHGPRRLGWHSGQGFLSVDIVDTLHAEAQAIWDMRRLLSWIRAQGAETIGAFGLSLGGYTTALFASVAEGLAAAIPGIPLADVPRVLDRHGVAHQMRYARSRGFSFERAREVLRPVSPLAVAPRVPHEGRLIFGATADRLVTPDHVRDLWRHWDEPEIVWYEGSHVSFGSERAVWAAVDRTLRENGLTR